VSGEEVDLNPGFWTTAVAPVYNTAMFQNFISVLEGMGGQASLVTPAGLLRSFVGLKLSVAAVLYSPLDYATSSVSIEVQQ